MVLQCVEAGGVTYNVLAGLSISTTGSLFLTMLFIVFLLMIVAVAMRIPVEFTAIIVLPLALTLLACDGDWLAITGLLLIYLGILLGKNFFFR